MTLILFILNNLKNTQKGLDTMLYKLDVIYLNLNFILDYALNDFLDSIFNQINPFHP